MMEELTDKKKGMMSSWNDEQKEIMRELQKKMK